MPYGLGDGQKDRYPHEKLTVSLHMFVLTMLMIYLKLLGLRNLLDLSMFQVFNPVHKTFVTPTTERKNILLTHIKSHFLGVTWRAGSGAKSQNGYVRE